MSSLLRSTKFVRYFAGAARTLLINSAKTAESNQLLNSKAICVANNVLMRDYGTSKKSENLEPLLQKLDNEVRRYGRISKRDIDEVFDEIRAKSDITSSQSLLIIRCCGELVPEELPEQRTLLVQKIWSVLAERGVPMDISHYNALLRVYIENEHLFSPAEFLNELERKGLQPNRVTYQRLMWRYCYEGDVEGATKVLEKMRELSLPVSEPVLNALVMGHAFHGDTDGASAVLETMAGAGLQPSNRTYALLACGFAKKGDVAGIESILNKANEKDIVYTDKDILDIVEALAISGHGDKIESMLSHLQKSLGYTQEACNLILRLINKGQENLAKIILKTLPHTEKKEDTMYKGAFFVKQLLKVQKSPEAIVRLCRELQEEQLVPKALYIATEAALQQGHSEVALLLFKELEKDGIEIRQHYYWPLLIQKGKENDEEGLLEILRQMGTSGFPPSGEALRDYVLPYLRVKDSPQNVMVKLQIANIPRSHSARNLMSELLESGNIKEAAEIALQYRPYGFYALINRPLINALSQTKDIRSFATILHVISSKPLNTEDEQVNEVSADDKNDSNEVGRIILSAVKNIPVALCEALLTEVHKKGLRISISSAEAIQQYLGQNLSPSISEKLAQLTSPDLEIQPINSMRRASNATITLTTADLERLVAQSDGATVLRYKKQLLNAYMQENQVEKLTNYIKSLESENFELTSSTIAELIAFYATNDDIEKAMQYKQVLDAKEPKFILNKFKLIHLAYAMVRANRFDEAVKFLRENGGEQDGGGTFMINSKSWQMLNTLAENKEVEKVKEMTKVLIEQKYVEPSNVILGPCIKVHLLRDDIESALKEFEGACQQYRCTPWNGELMKTLILKEDASKLQWLADLSTQIHGEVNILHDLVLAFVECGRLRQARRILETPGMQTRQKRLDNACERYVQEGKPECLERLLEATKELSYIDRTNIFYHLLKSYCKQMETDKALGLWTLLQEEGEIPSDQFLNYLGKHLKANNRQVPFAIPNEAVKVQPKLPTKKIANPQPTKPYTKSELTDKLELLIKQGELEKAVATLKTALKAEVIPKYNVVKYLLKKLADQSKVEDIQAIGEFLTENAKRNVSYNGKLTLAVFNKGQGQQHIEELYNTVSTIQTEEEMVKAMVKFPRSNVLSSCIIENKDLLVKCQKIAEISASKSHYMPVNLLWTEYLLSGKEQEADAIWNQYLKNSTRIAYKRLLQECHTKNQPQLIEKLISYLKTNNNMTPGTLANVYSRLINLHSTYSNTEEAKKCLERALADGLKIEDINTSSLKRLKETLETIGEQFKYTIPEKSNDKA